MFETKDATAAEEAEIETAAEAETWLSFVGEPLPHFCSNLYTGIMGIREDEKRWKRIQDALAAEASGKEPRPVSSMRTLFGIQSSVEQQIERIVAEDEASRRDARKQARDSDCDSHDL